MIPRFHRAVCHYFTLWNTAGADCTVKSESRSRLPVSQNQGRFHRSALVILHESVRDSDLLNVCFGPLCGLKSDISRGPRSAMCAAGGRRGNPHVGSRARQWPPSGIKMVTRSFRSRASCCAHVRDRRDELPLPYSITSSARCWRNQGTSRPSALAVLRLMTISNLLGACTGRSAGFSPRSIRSTYLAAGRHCST
jgi:hypothetical protein